MGFNSGFKGLSINHTYWSRDIINIHKKKN